jgi:hypothetical protein
MKGRSRYKKNQTTRMKRATREKLEYITHIEAVSDNHKSPKGHLA